MMDFEDGSIRARMGEHYRPFYSNYSDTLQAAVDDYDPRDVAAAAQTHLEEMVVKQLRHLAVDGSFFSRRLCLAGGVFGNVKLTQAIKESGLFDAVFVQPQMGDGGLALGAAAGAQHDRNIRIDTLETMCLGPDIDDNELARLADHAGGLMIERVDATTQVERICKDLEAGRVIGLARGAMEFGPRALCHRSIVYKTTDPTVNDWLNERMNRTEFMPFAPVVRIEDGTRCFLGFDAQDPTLRYMTATIGCTDEFAAACPAVTHIDNTARPQIVTQESDAFMWQLLSRWQAVSGELSLINTSFNAHEEPIVCTEADVLTGVTTGMVDVLCTETLRITRAT